MTETATIFFTMIITIFASSTTTIVSPAEATSAAGNNTAATITTTPSLELEFSPQPVWDETVRTTGIFPINETHSIATFEGNGTMTVPSTGQTVNMTNNGTAFGNIVPQANNTVVSYGRENVFAIDDGDTSAITFFEIIQYDPVTLQGRGIVTAVFDNNATGSLAPFNGMLVAGTHEEGPSTEAVTIRLWEWESGLPLPTPNANTTTIGGAPLRNTTTTAIDAATVVETNTTSISQEEAEASTIGGLSEEQQQLSIEEQRQAVEEEQQATTAPS
ncbi:MAG: hypothetical protein M3115_04745 [Thermoproteota archaeon]|nr:hypothetical protein [Thermoproteota archaeon]